MKPTLGLMLLGVLAGCGNGTGASATASPDQPTQAPPASPPPLEEIVVDALPLQRGFFVDAGTPCAQASNATLKLHHGSGFGAARENCDFDRIVRSGPATYTATQTCTDIQSGRAEPSTVVLEIQGPTAFSGNNLTYEWKYSARHCPQRDLPEPWRSNDISDLMD